MVGALGGGAAAEAVLRFTVDDGTGQGLSSIRDRVSAALSPQALGIAGLTAVAAGLGAATVSAANYARELGIVSDRTGLSVELLDRYSQRLQLTGGEIEDLEDVLRTLGERAIQVEQGSSDAAEVLGLLGISAEEVSNATPLEQIDLLARGLRDIEDPLRRSATASEVLGDAGSRAAVALVQGVDGIRASVDTDLAEATAEFQGHISGIGATLTGIGGNIAGGLVPAINELIRALRDEEEPEGNFATLLTAGLTDEQIGQGFGAGILRRGVPLNQQSPEAIAALIDVFAESAPELLAQATGGAGFTAEQVRSRTIASPLTGLRGLRGLVGDETARGAALYPVGYGGVQPQPGVQTVEFIVRTEGAVIAEALNTGEAGPVDVQFRTID